MLFIGNLLKLRIKHYLKIAKICILCITVYREKIKIFFKMSALITIGFSSGSSLNRGTAFWKGQHYAQICEFYNLESLNRSSILKGIGYITGSANISVPCRELSIDSFEITTDYFTVNYTPLDECGITSGSLKRAIRDILSSQFGQIMNLPFCAIIEEKIFNCFLEDESLIMQIKQLKKHNNWEGIVKLFEPVEEIYKLKHIWNNPLILDALSFATAKSSEVYVNLNKTFKTNEEKQSFLKSRKKHRKNTILIRKRCIELCPENPSYYSNLAYSHYQHCLELSMKGGRRDGNISTEAEKAIENIDNALALDPNRINDLYRKGQILSQILPPNILFRNKTAPDVNVITDVRDKIKQGIKCFQKVEEVYEIIPLIDEKSLERYKKEYIKSLYNTAVSYCGLVIQKQDYKFNIDECEQNGKKNNIKKYYKDDTDNINSAIYYIEKCIQKDSKMEGKPNLPEGIILGACDGAVDGVYKLYTAGKINFQKFIILKNEGKANEGGEFLFISRKYLKSALKFPFPVNKKSINKAFIAERLARTYIIAEDFQNAVRILEYYVNKEVDYYVRYTYAYACIKLGLYEKAYEQLKLSLRNEKSNKDISTGKSMLSYVCQKTGKSL